MLCVILEPSTKVATYWEQPCTCRRIQDPGEEANSIHIETTWRDLAETWRLPSTDCRPTMFCPEGRVPNSVIFALSPRRNLTAQGPMTYMRHLLGMDTSCLMIPLWRQRGPSTWVSSPLAVWFWSPSPAMTSAPLIQSLFMQHLPGWAVILPSLQTGPLSPGEEQDPGPIKSRAVCNQCD